MRLSTVESEGQPASELGQWLDAALTDLRSPQGQPAREEIPRLLGKLAEMRALLEGSYLRQPAPPAVEDRLLKIDEAAERIGMSKDYLYRQADRLPFTVRQGRCLRFSANAISRYLQRIR